MSSSSIDSDPIQLRVSPHFEREREREITGNGSERTMDIRAEFDGVWGREFVAGGISGVAAVISGHPLDTLKIRQQSSKSGSAFNVLHRVISSEGPSALYRGMGAPLASITFQNAMVFQIYAVLSRMSDSNIPREEPPSYRGVTFGGFGAGALQCLLTTPVELVKIRLQLQNKAEGPMTTMSVSKRILKNEGFKGIYKGLSVTIARDAPAHSLYFLTYEYVREWLHPGCRRTGDESLKTMLAAGGLAGAASWLCCYPLDVVKTRLQAESSSSSYQGIIDCFRKSVKEDGYGVLWRGFGTTISRAFVVNGTVFAAYEITLRCLFNRNNRNIQAEI